MQSQWAVAVQVREWPGGRAAGQQGSRASDFFQPATLVVEVANDGWPAARVQYLLRGRACAVEPWPGVRTYGVWPQVLFMVEDGERAESWVDRPLPSQDDELLLRGLYVAGRGEIESPGESAGESSGEGAGPGARESAGPGAGPGAGEGAGRGLGRVLGRALGRGLGRVLGRAGALRC